MKRKMCPDLCKVYLFLLCGSWCIFGSLAVAKESSLGLGVILGNPTGINVNWQLESNRALDLQLGWSPRMQHLNATYQIWFPRAFNADGVIFDWYYGFGIHRFYHERVRRNERMEIGLRIPFGLAHQLREYPAISFFGELGPTINFVEESSFIIDFGLGVRFYL